ncbi:F0F1 ATP synthase subunit epsilon [Caldinitratiruptor microaerophilus]|uniref:ATP synthase epsilon chain n=1 Tax=Caldinitratiruptor microaerophilus TaxID=671077 RepID=A0AA35CMB0_9FIRM|nr:F0F1 ATP synthase subunit epsilon [Caldinitratiruptor microaerophilus]BDG61762.1 ATP synthase epsilon chain [Caldinitratiruptor microaerophilus]
MAALQLTVITPERTVLRQVETGAVVLPVVDGSMGILPRHAPMVAALRIGVLKYRTASGRYEPVAVAGGFAEVTGQKVTVLAEAAEQADEIDVLRAKAARERAEARLRQRGADIDEARARAALQRALVRLRVAEEAGVRRGE